MRPQSGIARLARYARSLSEHRRARREARRHSVTSEPQPLVAARRARPDVRVHFALSPKWVMPRIGPDENVALRVWVEEQTGAQVALKTDLPPDMGAGMRVLTPRMHVVSAVMIPLLHVERVQWRAVAVAAAQAATRLPASRASTQGTISTCTVELRLRNRGGTPPFWLR